ncbi:RAVE subunit 2/Rogdi [Plectosphaerella plurivora]|uniref:RAVE subunit 2/Rogdi n=1 Tax=Plectosphaerella plurivora TaxID=936078 RepID=A0A9P8V911_9PEZI|nr:RAVE subunit 2/Rogdi [Plectosphaerella plurivora]
MSVDIWPHVSPEEFEVKRQESLARELEWMLKETRDFMEALKHGLQDCYALLAPVDPGSTLVLTTPRAEKVKGHITRVGTRIVKGTINVQLKMLPAQTLVLDPDHPIHLPALESLNTYISESLGLLSICLSTDTPANPHTISDHLRALSTTLTASIALLKGHSSTDPNPDPSWQTESAPPVHFSPGLQPHLSFHLALSDASLVLHLRALELADAPVHLGMKMALALGTFRRLEHDEMDRTFHFRYSRFTDGAGKHIHKRDMVVPRRASSSLREASMGFHAQAQPGQQAGGTEDVFVREKVKVETADPSLLSLFSKLVALNNSLNQARRNLAAVMGEDMDDSS